MIRHDTQLPEPSRTHIAKCQNVAVSSPTLSESYFSSGGFETTEVSSGFVGAIKADRVTGNISLVLEVEVYQAEVEAAGHAGPAKWVVGQTWGT